MIPGAMLLLATACSHPDKANDPSPPTVFDTTSVSLLADDGENLLLPSDVEIGLDDTLWVLGARSRVASIDLTVPEIRDVWVLDFGFAAADGFIVTPDGQLWVPEANGKRLARIDPETLAVETIDTGFNVLSGSAPREDGGLVLTGTTGSDAGIKLVDSDGQVGDPSSVGGTVGQPYVDGDQVLVTRLDARGQSWLSTYSFPELELVSDVHAPFFGHQLAILSDGKLLMVDTTHIGAYDFESDTWEEGALGVDNHSLYALGDTALVIDLGSTIEQIGRAHV